ncbi:hypothetical protein ABIB51_002149 [Arthrobacter sp. UYCu712]
MTLPTSPTVNRETTLPVISVAGRGWWSGSSRRSDSPAPAYWIATARSFHHQLTRHRRVRRLGKTRLTFTTGQAIANLSAFLLPGRQAQQACRTGLSWVFCSGASWGASTCSPSRSAVSPLGGLIYDSVVAELATHPMSDVLDPILGSTPARARTDFWNGDRFWASAKDITGAQFGVVTNTAETITKLAVTGTKAKPLPTGSVILTARGTVGAVARLAMPSSFNQSCYGFIPGAVRHLIQPQFLQPKPELDRCSTLCRQPWLKTRGWPPPATPSSRSSCPASSGSRKPKRKWPRPFEDGCHCRCPPIHSW